MPKKPFKGIAGFWISGLYSPWRTWEQIATQHLAAKDSASRQVFTNAVLAETFEDAGTRIDDAPLMARREQYAPTIPKEAGLLTAGVDVQDNRLEVQVMAWGLGREAWVIERRILPGIPHMPEVWAELDEYLKKQWRHESGAMLNILCASVDSGDQTDTVYRWVKPREARRIFAVKGVATPNAQPLRGPSQKKTRRKNLTLAERMKIQLQTVNVTTAKDWVFRSLENKIPGPSYIHFPMECDEEYFAQLTSEERKRRLVNRVWTTIYEKKKKGRKKRSARPYRLLPHRPVDIRVSLCRPDPPLSSPP